MIDLTDPEREFGGGIETVEDWTGVIGFRGTALSRRGKLQEFKSLDDLQFADLLGSGLVVGADKRVYEERKGLIECMTPAKPVGEEEVFIVKVDYESLPPVGELAWLYDKFFSQYDREVLMLMGKCRKGSGWLYFVPEQVGSSGFVEWEASDEEMGWFQTVARWVGTIHIHPGIDKHPSQTDIDDWSKPEKSGLHIIFGQDGGFTVCAAIAGRTICLYSDTVEGTKIDTRRTPVLWTNSGGRSLEELLKKPKPICPPVKTDFQAIVDTKLEGRSPLFGADATGLPEWEEKHIDQTLKGVGALPMELRDLRGLRLIKNGSQYWIVTLDQWLDLRDGCKDVCPVPTHRKLKVRVDREGE